MLISELRALLEAHNVPFREWKPAPVRRLQALHTQVASGEVVLVEHSGRLLREIIGSAVHVFYRDRERVLRLREDRQVFNDGRVRHRRFGHSVGEKLKPGEEPLAAALRALKEELHIATDLPLCPSGVLELGPYPSELFPGLWTFYRTHVFETWLSTELYRADGYIETQPDKTSYFVWSDT